MTSDLPNDLQAEQAALGGMLLSRDAVSDVLDVIKADDYYRPAHQLVHEVVARLFRRGEPVDAVTVGAELTRHGDLGRVGGAPYLHTLIASVPAAANAGYYAQIVREMAVRRTVIEHSDRMRQAACDVSSDLVTVRDLAAAAAAVSLPDSGARGRRLVLTPASEIQIEPVVWAWDDEGHGRIPAGSLGLFAGREGTGKSCFLTWLAARITTGTLPGSLSAPRAVIYVAVEDSWKHTIAPRLIASGADLKRVQRAEVQTIQGDFTTLSLPTDTKLLEQAIVDNNVALVALDPLLSAISDTLDTHVNRQVRQALDPLARLADRTGAVIGGIAHFNKSGGTDASSLITASGAFKDVARFIFAFAADDDQDGADIQRATKGVITQTKNSLGFSNLPSLAYRVIEAVVPTATGDTKVGRLVIDGQANRTVSDVLSFQQAPAGDRDEKTRAEDFLRKALASGPRPSREVEDEARNGHQIAVRTLARARQALNIATAKKGSTWCMALPEHQGDLAEYEPPAETSKAANSASNGMVGKHAKGANPLSPSRVGTVGRDDHSWPAGSIGAEAQG